MLFTLFVISAAASAPTDIPCDTAPVWASSTAGIVDGGHVGYAVDYWTALDPWVVVDPGTLLTGTEVIDLTAAPATQPPSSTPETDARVPVEAESARSTVARSQAR